MKKIILNQNGAIVSSDRTAVPPLFDANDVPYEKETVTLPFFTRAGELGRDNAENFVSIEEREIETVVFYCDSVSWDGDDTSRDESGDGTGDDPWRNVNYACEMIIDIGWKLRCLSACCPVFPFSVQLKVRGTVDYYLEVANGFYDHFVLSPWETGAVQVVQDGIEAQDVFIRNFTFSPTREFPQVEPLCSLYRSTLIDCSASSPIGYGGSVFAGGMSNFYRCRIESASGFYTGFDTGICVDCEVNLNSQGGETILYCFYRSVCCGCRSVLRGSFQWLTCVFRECECFRSSVDADITVSVSLSYNNSWFAIASGSNLVSCNINAVVSGLVETWFFVRGVAYGSIYDSEIRLNVVSKDNGGVCGFVGRGEVEVMKGCSLTLNMSGKSSLVVAGSIHENSESPGCFEENTFSLSAYPTSEFYEFWVADTAYIVQFDTFVHDYAGFGNCIYEKKDQNGTEHETDDGMYFPYSIAW